MLHDLVVKDPYEEVLTDDAARARNYLRTIREQIRTRVEMWCDEMCAVEA